MTRQEFAAAELAKSGAMGTVGQGVAEPWFGVATVPLISVWSVALVAAAAAPSAAKTLQALFERRLRRRTREIIAAASRQLPAFVHEPLSGKSLAGGRTDDGREA